MKTKQKVKLKYITPLHIISEAIRYSRNNHHLSDTTDEMKANNCVGSKDYDLIKKVGFHMLHLSTLEHSLIVYHVELTTKALLEMTRSRIGVAYTVTSSRYALDSMGIEFEPTGDEAYDKVLSEFNKNIKYLLSKGTKRNFDRLAELLPQSFIYKMQVSFNLRSLVHFLELRTGSGVHKDIRYLANKMIDELPNHYKELVLENKIINKNYNG